MFSKPLTALEKENFVYPVSNSAISLCASSTEFKYPKLSACLPSSNGSRLKILAMLFLFVPQESWDLQLRMFGYITCGFPRIFGYVLQVIKYSISVPLDRGGFGGWNLMLTFSTIVCQGRCGRHDYYCARWSSHSWSLGRLWAVVIQKNTVIRKYWSPIKISFFNFF